MCEFPLSNCQRGPFPILHAGLLEQISIAFGILHIFLKTTTIVIAWFQIIFIENLLPTNLCAQCHCHQGSTLFPETQSQGSSRGWASRMGLCGMKGKIQFWPKSEGVDKNQWRGQILELSREWRQILHTGWNYPSKENDISFFTNWKTWIFEHYLLRRGWMS